MLLILYPLMEPIIMPLTKYLCRKGYAKVMGIMATIMVANFTASSWLRLRCSPVVYLASSADAQSERHQNYDNDDVDDLISQT